MTYCHQGFESTFTLSGISKFLDDGSNVGSGFFNLILTDPYPPSVDTQNFHGVAKVTRRFNLLVTRDTQEDGFRRFGEYFLHDYNWVKFLLPDLESLQYPMGSSTLLSLLIHGVDQHFC